MRNVDLALCGVAVAPISTQPTHTRFCILLIFIVNNGTKINDGKIEAAKKHKKNNKKKTKIVYYLYNNDDYY